MSEDFSIKVNRKEGIVEVEGSDKEWVASQLERLSVVYESPPEQPRKEEASESKAGSSSPPKEGQASKPRRGRARKAGARSSARASKNPELEKVLTPELRTALQAFIDERENSWKNKTNQAPIIATFLMDKAHSEGWINEDDLYTVYSVMGWPSPSNFRAQIDNGRSRKGYFGSWAEGRTQLTHAGEQFGRHGSKDA